MMNHKIQVIQNGLLVIAENDNTVYYPNIDEAIAGITESLKEKFKASQDFEWDGACTVSLSVSVSGLPV